MRVAAPVAYGLVGGVFERVVARKHGAHLGAEHLHALHVDVLALNVERPLVYHTGHVHQCAHRCHGHTVLPCACLGYDSLLPHLLRKEYLAHGIVYLVGPGVVQVFALKV